MTGSWLWRCDCDAIVRRGAGARKLVPDNRRRRGLIFLLGLTVAASSSWLTACGDPDTARAAGVVYLQRDLSGGNLSQWTHRDYGLGTDEGGNASGGGYLWYHANVKGRRAAGMTVTPTARASPAEKSDSVYLWEPTGFWNYQPHEIWLRTSVLFPSEATIEEAGYAGERPFQPTTGEWNWFLEFHNDSNPQPGCTKEFANVSLDVKTDDAVRADEPGVKNARLAARVMGGKDCAPEVVWIDGPALRLDHWYEILLRIKWGTHKGTFEWYVDDFNTPIYSNKKIATLFTRPKGFVSPSYTSLTVPNYRLHARWSSTIYAGPLAVGSTKSAVMNAF